MPHTKSIQREVTVKVTENKHLIMGYAFLFLVFMGVMTAVYYWEYKGRGIVDRPVDAFVGSGEQIPTNSDCIPDKITARHKSTGEIREFPSRCNVSENWEIR
jgi:hypothetical protein